jgi:tetratricopeptide (TPR) repeat protein
LRLQGAGVRIQALCREGLVPGKDIFLSYASEERQRIVPLVRALERTGWSVFWDVEGIRGGADWRDVLEAEAAGSRCVIVAWSSVSVKRPFVRDEAEEGRRRKVLVPVRIDPVDPPLGFRGTQYRDLTDWDGRALSPVFQELVRDLTALLGPPLSPIPTADRVVRSARRTQEEAEETARQARRVQQQLEAAERARHLDKGAEAGGAEASRRPWFLRSGLLVAAAALVLVTSSVLLWRTSPAASYRVDNTQVAEVTPTAESPPPPVLATPAPATSVTPGELSQTPEYWVKTSDARYEGGDFDGAIEGYNEAIRLKPDYPYAYFSRGWARKGKGDLDGAIEDYNEAIRLEPSYPEAYFSLGSARSAKGDLDRAMKDYTEAIRLRPDYSEAFVSRGRAREDSGDLDGAIKDYDEAIRLKPDDEMAYHHRGIARKEKGDLDGALKDYSEAIRLKPDYANAYYNRGSLLEKMGVRQTAADDLQKYLTLGGGRRDGDQAEVEARIRKLRQP